MINRNQKLTMILLSSYRIFSDLLSQNRCIRIIQRNKKKIYGNILIFLFLKHLQFNFFIIFHIFMSIYSGFATRFQQEAYDNCIDSLLYILQKRIIKFYQGDNADEEKFVTLVLKIHHQMRIMEKNKYLQPKSSLSVSELIKFLNSIHHQTNTKSNPNQNSNNSTNMVQNSQPLEEKSSLPDISIQKKKSVFWVQRKPIEQESSKTHTQQEAQTMGTINKNVNGHTSKDSKTEFKRTAYQPPNIRAFNFRNSSKPKLIGQRQQERYLGMPDEKQPKKRAMSNHIRAKPSIHYRETEEQGQNSQHHVQKRKNRSVTRNNEYELTGNEGQVTDIIKDYIIKAKKNYLRGHRNRDSKESSNRIHDF